MPLAEFTVAMVEFPLYQVPRGVASVNVSLRPTQLPVEPTMGLTVGMPFIVTTTLVVAVVVPFEIWITNESNEAVLVDGVYVHPLVLTMAPVAGAVADERDKLPFTGDTVTDHVSVAVVDGSVAVSKVSIEIPEEF